MMRGWLNARSQEVLSQFGDVNATIEVEHASELTIEYLCERLLHLFSADFMDFSLEALRAEYGKTVAQMQEEEERKRREREAAAREEQLKTHAPTREEALKGVREDR